MGTEFIILLGVQYPALPSQSRQRTSQVDSRKSMPIAYNKLRDAISIRGSCCFSPRSREGSKSKTFNVQAIRISSGINIAGIVGFLQGPESDDFSNDMMIKERAVTS